MPRWLGVLSSTYHATSSYTVEPRGVSPCPRTRVRCRMTKPTPASSTSHMPSQVCTYAIVSSCQVLQIVFGIIRVIFVQIHSKGGKNVRCHRVVVGKSTL